MIWLLILNIHLYLSGVRLGVFKEHTPKVCVFTKYWTTISKFVNHCRLNNPHNRVELIHYFNKNKLYTQILHFSSSLVQIHLKPKLWTKLFGGRK